VARLRRHPGPACAEAILAFVRERGLASANTRCRVTDGWRTALFELLFNHVLPWLSPPPFPGFNVFISRPACFDVGGFASGPDEDVTFSRRLDRAYPTATRPLLLVETSDRRIAGDRIAQTSATIRHWSVADCAPKVVTNS
jgi:hypothetical protein